MTTEELRDREKELRKTYKRILPGSIRKETKGLHKDKITVEIKCAHRGCNEVRRVATSDLHQVNKCMAHTLEDRMERRREARRSKAKSKAS